MVLSLFFRATCGIERIFHFETLADVGFGLLTGGASPVARDALGHWVRAVSTHAVLRFVRATRRLGQIAHTVATVSIDEHVIARWTRKFRIPKGYHTIRNKHMKSEKVFTAFVPATRQFLALAVTRGKASLAACALAVVRLVRQCARPKALRIILDAGAAQRHADLAALNRQRKTVFLVRVPRRPAYVTVWKTLPDTQFSRLEEPGPYTKAPPKVIHLVETRLRVGGIDEPVRTLVVREEGRRGKDRWHAIYVLHDDHTPAVELLHEYRTRQHHEQAFRIGVHDMALDTAPSGYNKRSKDPDRPGFKRNALTLQSWVIFFAFHVLRDFTAKLPARFHGAHPRTIRRYFLERGADLYLTRSHLVVFLDPFPGQSALRPLVEDFNARPPSLPWLDNKRVVICLSPRQRRRSLLTPEPDRLDQIPAAYR